MNELMDGLVGEQMIGGQDGGGRGLMGGRDLRAGQTLPF